MAILPAGDEVTISYIGDIEDAVSQRRHRLLQGWDFLCKCPRCEVEDSLPRSITRLVATMTDQMNAEEDKPGRILSLYRQGRLQMFHWTPDITACSSPTVASGCVALWSSPKTCAVHSQACNTLHACNNVTLKMHACNSVMLIMHASNHVISATLKPYT